MTPRQRLNEKLAPAYLALGEVLSTETGKYLMVMAYDAGNSMAYAQQREHESDGKRPTRQHDRDVASVNHWLGQRLAYVSALSAMVAERCGYAASKETCRRVVNTELGCLEERTDGEREATDIRNLMPNHM